MKGTLSLDREALSPTCQARNTCVRIGPCWTWPGFDRDCSIELARNGEPG